MVGMSLFIAIIPFVLMIGIFVLVGFLIYFIVTALRYMKEKQATASRMNKNLETLIEELRSKYV